MRYATDPFTGILYHFDDVFNFCANDKDGSFFAYNRKPIQRWDYFSGGYKSQDLRITQPDSHYPTWLLSAQELTP